MSGNKLITFQGKTIRRTLFNDEWYFVIIDVIAALTDSLNPTDYVKKLKRRDPALSKGWGQIVTPLIIETYRK